MSTFAQAPAPAYTAQSQGWFARSEAWLDSKGKGAWIAAMVLGFIFAWPVGLALLFYMIWSKRMFNRSCRNSSRHQSARHGFSAMRASGNTAFDAYKEDTLRRLEDEQTSFEDFLQRLRDAKDKAEFDQFMDDRAKPAATSAEEVENA
jgi:predicted CopG family antitoxin